MKILFLIPYPLKEAPSQRFRFEQYVTILHELGHSLSFQCFLESRHWQLFFNTGKTHTKMIILIKGFIKRFFILLKVSQFDFVFIHREATPVGPPLIEWIIAKIFRKKIIYDFDDAIWLTDRVNESPLLRMFKWRSKVGSICRWSYRVSCGNDYLCNYAKQFNQRVIYNPTTIDTSKLHNPLLHTTKKINSVVIGWTGSHSTLKYLEELEPVLKKVEEKKSEIKILVIADRAPMLHLRSVSFIPWSKKSEMEDLLKIDIGIMPLPADEWSKGKCGFKALQYMALQIPTVASPVGVNTKIIDAEVNGFLPSTAEDWINTLEKLIVDTTLRKEIGERGREKIIRDYSVVSNTSTFLSLFA